MTDLNSEFRFLQWDAERVGRSSPLPKVTRVTTPVSEGRSISALRYDPAEPPTYAFVHGMGLNAHGYDPVALALDEPALAIDLPGHGRSDWRDDANYRPDVLAPDVVTALHSLAPEPFTLVGHSLGGLTASLAAPHLTGRLRGVVLVDISPGVRPQRDAGSISDFISGKRKFDTLEEMVQRAIDFGIGKDREALTRGVALNTRRRADGYWEWTHHFAHMEAAPAGSFGSESPFAPIWGVLESVAAGGTPVALVRGSEGIIDDELLREWREKLPESRVITISGPHNLHEASPVELARALRESPQS